MKKLSFRIFVLLFLPIFLGLACNALHGQVILEKFYYENKRAGGQVGIKVMVYGTSTNKTINLKDTRGVIDLNKFEGEVQLLIQFRSLKLGLKPDYLNQVKYPKHKYKYYLDVPFRSEFMPKSFDGLQLVNNRSLGIAQEANLGRKESSNIVYKVIDGKFKGEIRLSFRIVKEMSRSTEMWSEGMLFSFSYQIIARKTPEKVNPDIAAAESLYKEIISSLSDDSRHLMGLKYLALYKDINSSWTSQIEKLVASLEGNMQELSEETTWNNIQAGVQTSNKIVVFEEANHYIKTYPNGKYIDQVYYHAIDHLEDKKNEQKKLFNRFKSHLPNSVYLERLVHKYSHLKEKGTEESNSDVAPPPASGSAKSKDQKAFESAKKKKSVEALEKYIRDYPTGKFKTQARKLIDELSPLTLTYRHLEGSEYQLEITGNSDNTLPNFNFSHPEARFLRWKDASSFSQAIVSIPSGVVVTIEVKADNKRELIDIDNSIDPLKGIVSSDDTSITISAIEGGQPPYFLVFESAGVFIYQKELGNVTSTVLNFKDLDVVPGIYDVVLTDNSKKERIEFEKMEITPTGGLNGLQLLIVALIMVAIMVITVFFMYRRFLKNQEEEVVTRTEEKLELDPTVKTDAMQVNKVEYSASRIKDKRVEEAEVKKHLLTRVELEKPTFTNKPNFHGLKEESLQKDYYYFSIPLDTIWKDSMVAEVCLERGLIRELKEIVLEKKQDQFGRPKVAAKIGLLLGNAEGHNSSNSVKLKVQKLLTLPTPSDSLGWDRVTIENAIQNVGDIKEGEKQLQLIGWFQTQTGQGLFLSQKSLEIHEKMFDKPFQVVLQFDNLKSRQNPNIDFGCFTKTANGRMNNVENQQAPWPDLNEVEQWLEA